MPVFTCNTQQCLPLLNICKWTATNWNREKRWARKRANCHLHKGNSSSGNICVDHSLFRLFVCSATITTFRTANWCWGRKNVRDGARTQMEIAMGKNTVTEFESCWMVCLSLLCCYCHHNHLHRCCCCWISLQMSGADTNVIVRCGKLKRLNENGNIAVVQPTEENEMKMRWPRQRNVLMEKWWSKTNPIIIIHAIVERIFIIAWQSSIKSNGNRRFDDMRDLETEIATIGNNRNCNYLSVIHIFPSAELKYCIITIIFAFAWYRIRRRACMRMYRMFIVYV